MFLTTWQPEVLYILVQKYSVSFSLLDHPTSQLEEHTSQLQVSDNQLKPQKVHNFPVISPMSHDNSAEDSTELLLY